MGALLAAPRWSAVALPLLLWQRRRPWFERGASVPLLLAASLGYLDRMPHVAAPPAAPVRVHAAGWIASAPEASAWGNSATFVIDSLCGGSGVPPANAHRWRGAELRLVSRRSLPNYGTPLAVRGVVRAGRGARNFGAPAEATWLVAAGTIGVLTADTLHVVLGTRGAAWRREILEPVRARLAATMDAVLAAREAGLLKALAVGRRDGVDADVAAAWSAVGVTHILSISGMHVALVAGAVLALCGPPHRRRGLAALLACVWIYAALGGLGPTVLRATLMTSWAAVATYLGRTRRPLFGLGIASLFLLLQAPARRVDLGLQLSCLATGGLLLAAPALTRLASQIEARGRSGRALAWSLSAVGVGLSAQAATLPLQFARFGTVSWCAPAANLILVPLTDLALALGLVGAPLHLCAPQLGRPLLLLSGALLHIALRLPLWVTQHVTTCLYPRVDQTTIALATLVAGAALGALAALGAGRSRWLRVALATGALSAIALACAAAHPAAPRWRCEALDVGQGDALLLTIGTQMWLVDTGDVRPVDAGARVVVPHLHRLGVRHVRGLVLTHGHGDHCGGAASVLRAITADTLYLSRAAVHDSALQAVCVAFPALPTRWLTDGDSLLLAPGYTASVLWPAAAPPARPGGNARSLALWTHGNGLPELLLMGDVEMEEEAALLARWTVRLAAARAAPRLLKAGHHGSVTSSSEAFLAAVSPDIAIVSVGAHNRYAHPAPRTLHALQSRGVLVLRTDQGGAIRVTLRADALWCERPGGAPRLLAGRAVDVLARPP
jgi:competence protein ComEC